MPENDVRAGGAEAPLTYSERVNWFTEARFGMFVHWPLACVAGRGIFLRGEEKMPDEDFRAYAQEFTAANYRPREWARMARNTGYRYAVLISKHQEGFCLFDSKLTDFKSTNTPARRDLVREFLDAMREEGLRVGLYYSLIDWDYPHYPIDYMHPRRDDEQAKNRKRDWNKYLEYMHGQVRELMSDYGKIDILWLDYSYGDMHGEVWGASELVKMVRALQPDILLNNRLELRLSHDGIGTGGTRGDFATPEDYVPNEALVDSRGDRIVWEACMTHNHSWGYRREDRDFRSAGQIVRSLVECVSKGGNMLLNASPNALGEIQDECLAILDQVGRWMCVNGKSVYGCGCADLPKPEWGYYTRSLSDPKVLYAHIFNKPAGPLPLLGLGEKIKSVRFLTDASEVSLAKPWQVGLSFEENPKDLYLGLPQHNLPDSLDTVLQLNLKEV